MKRLSMAVVTAITVGFCGSVLADDLFMIGTKNTGRAEFFDNQDPNGTLLAGCPQGGENSGRGTFVYGVNVDGDFPGFFVTPDATSTNWKPFSCQEVEILFSVTQACVNPSLNYGRSGAETLDLFFNSEFVARTNSQENVRADFINPLGGFLLPGDHSVEIKAINRNNADGQAANDYVQMTCDPLAIYAKVSGRIDDPAAGTGRGAPLVTFSGQAGKTVSGAVVGSVDVLYKNFNGLVETSCTFTPTATSDIKVEADLKVNLIDFENSCDGTKQRVTIYDKNWDGSAYCLNANGRGCIGVDGGLSYPYRISEGLASGNVGPADYSADIDAGNGIVIVY
jgi:hypothetical protein